MECNEEKCHKEATWRVKSLERDKQGRLTVGEHSSKCSTHLHQTLKRLTDNGPADRIKLVRVAAQSAESQK